MRGVIKMIFSKNIKKACLYCAHGKDYSGDRVLCEKRGPVAVDFKCRKFEYDPLRRQPAAPVKPKLNVSEDDFKL